MANRRRPRSRLHAVMRWGLLALLILFVYWDNTALRTDFPDLYLHCAASGI